MLNERLKWTGDPVNISFHEDVVIGFIFRNALDKGIGVDVRIVGVDLHFNGWDSHYSHVFSVVIIFRVAEPDFDSDLLTNVGLPENVHLSSVW